MGVWIAGNEGPKFWLYKRELQNRSVEDTLILCVDGFKGFSDAINALTTNSKPVYRSSAE